MSRRDKFGKKFTPKQKEPTVVSKWLRGQKRVCSLPRCSNGAQFQCLSCLKLRVPAHMSFFCSQKCQLQSWPHHKALHAKHQNRNNNRGGHQPWSADDDEGNGDDMDSTKQRGSKGNQVALARRFPPRAGNIWGQVSDSDSYTPASSDVGRALRLEVAPILNADKRNEKPGV